MSYEVKISKHLQDDKFNVDLINWQGNNGLSFNRAFEVSRQEADQEATKQSNLYNAKITDNTRQNSKKYAERYSAKLVMKNTKKARKNEKEI